MSELMEWSEATEKLENRFERLKNGGGGFGRDVERMEGVEGCVLSKGSAEGGLGISMWKVCECCSFLDDNLTSWYHSRQKVTRSYCSGKVRCCRIKSVKPDWD
jgi:hypothetical protein